jgi:hypothetical protein
VRPTGKRPVLFAASSACAFARVGAPAAPLKSAEADAWRRYTAAARPVAMRTAAALQKVAAGRFWVPELRRLIADYNHLGQMYASSGPAASLARTIALSEEQTAADALAARVSACAPAPPRPSTRTK